VLNGQQYWTAVAEDYPPSRSKPLPEMAVAVAEFVAKSAVGQLMTLSN
jgi:hypothetical protein